MKKIIISLDNFRKLYGIPDGCGVSSYPHPLGYVPMLDTRYLILA